jgi:hypothetical protein
MAREGMAWLISALRIKVNDVESGIWTDDELQTYLDMHREHIVREPLASGLSRLVYYSSVGMLELDVSLWDSNGSAGIEISNATYTVNLADGVFNFSSDQGYTSYYLDAKSYNLHGAIAECLEQLAMDPNKAKMWNRGSVSYTNYDLLEMAKYHRNLMGIQSINVVRGYKE